MRTTLMKLLTYPIGLLLVFSSVLKAQSLEHKLDNLLDSVYNANQDALGILIHVESPDHKLSWTRAAGFSDSARSIPLEANQPVLIASNTKTYVSAATLRLVEQGLIGLDSPILDLIDADSRTLLEQDAYDLQHITLRHLLSHTSGIHDHVDEAYFNLVIKRPQYHWTKQEQIQRAMAVGEPLSAPGTSFSYADINYLLLAEIIENKTKMPFYEGIRSLLKYKELGLKHSWFKDLEPTPSDLPAFAHQYAKDYTWDSHEIDHSWDLYGGGGMATTVKDAALFYQYLFEGAIIEDPAVLKEMYTYVLPSDVSKYCLGIYHLDFGFHLYYHGGWWGTDVNYSPESNTSIAVFTLNKEKREMVNPFLGKEIQSILSAMDEEKSATPKANKP